MITIGKKTKFQQIEDFEDTKVKIKNIKKVEVHFSVKVFVISLT